MVGIVQANRQKLVDTAHTGAQTQILLRGAVDEWQRGDIDLAQSLQPARRQGLSTDIIAMRAEIANPAIAVQNTRLFLPDRAITNQFHLHPSHLRHGMCQPFVSSRVS